MVVAAQITKIAQTPYQQLNLVTVRDLRTCGGEPVDDVGVHCSFLANVAGGMAISDTAFRREHLATQIEFGQLKDGQI